MIPRRTPLRPGPWRSRNPETRARLAQRRLEKRRLVSGGPWYPEWDYARFIREQDCALRGHGGHVCFGRVDAAHYVRRTRKPTPELIELLGESEDNWPYMRQVPLCRLAHRFLDVTCRNDAVQFYRLTGINLVSLAATLVDRAVRVYG